MNSYSVVLKGYIGKIDRLNRVIITFPVIKADSKREAKKIVKDKNQELKLKRFTITENERI